MITIRDRNERGKTKIDWLDSKHSFSFGYYQDPNYMGFGPLRVINEDIIKPASGFDRHPHNDMEIVSYVLEGELEHKDSMGTGSVIKPGEIQHMSAGNGVTHSEFNASKTNPVHLLQIWFLPEKKSIEPSYNQKSIDPKTTENQFNLAISKDGRKDSIVINQDIDFYIGRLDGSYPVKFETKKDRIQWIQIAKGEVNLNNKKLYAGDGAAISNTKELYFDKAINAEILIFDMIDLRKNN